MAVPLNGSSGAAPAADGGGDKVDILIVDDLPEKLLVFQTVLEDLGQNLVFVRSGSEALREVLNREFAVILLDVNMPDIDGFETATLIRRYKRSAHTPIIFITAYADEIQTARGYSLGAVDYILSPVVPEVLRSKVRVFVELQVLQRRIARQADDRVAHAAAEAALRVAEESNQRFACLSELSHGLSGLLDVDAATDQVLTMVVPRLVPAAALVFADERGQPQRAARRDGDGPILRSSAAELPAGGSGGIPLRHGERLIGWLRPAAEPTPLGAAVMDEVAIRAAVAIATAQIHQNLQAEIVERRRAETRLEEAGRRKDEFLAMLSHELRNPLAPIGNAVEITRRLGSHDSKLVWATEVIDRQVRQLTRLVDELLDVARIGQGKIVLQPAALELGALVVQCVDLQRPALAARRQTLTQALPPRPVWIHADPARMQQVINNLLSNANKYTPEGGVVHVAVTVDQGQAVLTVRDNGIGIEAELLPRVFDLFEQGKRALDRAQGGLGVGLTLVQRLVKLHDGRVEAHSAGPGLGSEFRVHLPCMPAESLQPAAAAAGAAPPLSRTSRRVLLVEDNADVAETTAAMLELAGHQVRIARDGEEALTAAVEFLPELVLLDIGLPRLDGYQVALRLRQLPQTRQARLIALTGYGMPADRARGREVGFDLHLLKPVDAEVLLALFDEATSAAGEGASTADAGASTATLYAFRRP